MMTRMEVAVAVLLLAAQTAVAQDEGSAEGLAVVRSGERASFERDTIAQYGPQARFEVTVTWDPATGPRPAEHMARRVRYVANCAAGTLTLVAVGVFDPDGSLLKSMIMPPGASDPVTPGAGSQEERWMREACRG